MKEKIKFGNKFNPERGRIFQDRAKDILSEYFRTKFHPSEFSIEIGNPPKNHKFDLVSLDKKYIGECKNHSWTKTGNVPAAKMALLNEAAFYLLHLESGVKKFIVMRKDVHRKRKETLAEYYYRINHHLLKDVFLIEVDNNKLKIIK